MEIVQLDRYELTGLQGSGADYEVRSGRDRNTGEEVVIKRPVPQMISRRMHISVEQRTERTIRLHEELANSIPQVCPMLGYTDQDNHDDFFGDGLEQEYRVTVSQRAPGIPLVGDPRARILRVPIGLGQNLFALFPLQNLDSDDPYPIQRQLLDAEEQFHRAGYVLLDLGPHNVFLSPAVGRISIIDPGALLDGENDRTPVGRASQDIHDFFLEVLKYYTAFQPPPAEVSGYRDPYNLRPVVNFEQELEDMARGLSGEPTATDDCRETGLAVIGRVRDRGYTSFDDFRSDYTALLEALRRRNSALPELAQARQAWSSALELLREDHWTKYVFDADREIDSLTID
ncbi:MAG: hypothetical protein OXI91_02580 [Chloroflexota bacterium]|nr:hypothetical protein [Chloroflexota bacterium]